MSRPCITLLTDFGLYDTYVGQMKGVIARINPDANVVDLTHEISSQQILAGSIALADSFCAFPKGSVHVAVVDPGVGSTRRQIAAEIGEHRFVCPDNGLLTLVLRDHKLGRVVELNEPRWWNSSVSNTFHGRDVFAPVAAAWSLGHDIAEFGAPLDSPLVQLAIPSLTFEQRSVTGSVIAIDRFGNLVTNVPRTAIPKQPMQVEIEIAGNCLQQIGSYYAEQSAGELIALFGSSERLEIAVTNGSAAEKLGVALGQLVRVRWQEQTP